MFIKQRGFLFAFAISVASISIVGEISYRAWLYWAFAVDGKFMIVTVDYPPSNTVVFSEGKVSGSYPPNSHFTLRQYSVDGSFQRSSYVGVNNLGWVSPYDFAFPKPVGEFRIAILGDSMTASINNNIPWPSVVQKELRKSMPHVLVMNLGNPGMSTQGMVRFTLPIARRLSADAVVVNIAFENLDFPLMPKDSERREKKKPWILFIGDVQVPFYCSDTLLNPGGCMVSNPWYVPQGRELSQSEVNDVKRRAAQLALRDRLLWSPKFFLFSPQGAMQSVSTASTDERIEAAIAALTKIKELYPNLIVLINPLEWYYEAATLPKIGANFIAKAKEARLDVIDMLEHLPQATAEERHGWWNMPADGHWSDRGAEIYGRAVADIIKKRLVGGPTARELSVDRRSGARTQSSESSALRSFREDSRAER